MNRSAASQASLLLSAHPKKGVSTFAATLILTAFALLAMLLYAAFQRIF